MVEELQSGRELTSVIDPKALQVIKDLQMEGEPSILPSVVQSYIKNVEDSIAQLHEKLPDPSFEEVHIFAHTLKSSSANVGAIHLSQISKELEFGCRDKTITDFGHHLKVIKTEFKKVKQTLEKEISRI